MDLQLRDKVIVVTGGAKGIGEGISRVLAAEGAIPVVIGRNTKDNEALVAAVVATGERAGYVTAELLDPAECKRAVEAVITQLWLSVGLVKNAGEYDVFVLDRCNYIM